MKLILSISLSFLFLMQGTGSIVDLGCELLKLPILIKHYQEQAEYEGTSLMEFINLHYGDGQEDQAHHDDEHDDKLPFHGQHKCFHGNVFAALFTNQINLAAFSFFDHTRVSHYRFFIGSEHSESPFQPPKA